MQIIVSVTTSTDQYEKSPYLPLFHFKKLDKEGEERVYQTLLQERGREWGRKQKCCIF